MTFDPTPEIHDARQAFMAAAQILANAVRAAFPTGSIVHSTKYVGQRAVTTTAKVVGYWDPIQHPTTLVLRSWSGAPFIVRVGDDDVRIATACPSPEGVAA